MRINLMDRKAILEFLGGTGAWSEPITLDKMIAILRAHEEALRNDSLPGYENIADMLPSMLRGGEICPLCGTGGVHDHSPQEIVIYRNGVRYGMRLAQQKGKEDSND